MGLDAQRTAVLNFVKNNVIIAEYTDIESGRNDERPELLKAIQKSKEEDCVLVISKLDRLSRNVSFISTLMDTKVRFVCADMPEANELTLHIFASLAQWERKRISERTRDALSELKKRGVKLGNPRQFTPEDRHKALQSVKRNAFNNRNNTQAKKLVDLMRIGGKTYRQIAIELNDAGFKTSKGKTFGPEQIRRLLKQESLLPT